jgi:hypothetical protein
MLNKRKAMMGWLIYTAAKPIAKRVLKRKAKGAVPGTRSGSLKAPNTAAILAGLAAIGAALMFWRRGSDSPSEETPDT